MGTPVPPDYKTTQFVSGPGFQLLHLDDAIVTPTRGSGRKLYVRDSLFGPQESFFQTLKQKAATAQARNPLNSGTFNAGVSGVSGVAVSWFTSGVLTQQIDYLAHPEAFAISGGIPFNSSGTFYFASDYLGPSAGGLSGIFTDPTSVPYNYSTQIARIRFMTDAISTEFHGTFSSVSQCYSCIIDGQYATPPGGLVPSANGGVAITFGSRGMHEIEIASTGSFGFRGIYVTNLLDDIWAPPDAVNDPLIVFDGDSYSAGGGISTPTDPDASWTQQCAFRLGWKNCLQTAVSSTGYLSIGNPFPGGALSTMRQRLLLGGWLGVVPKVIVAAGGYNDVTWIEASSVTQAQVVAEAILCWQAYRKYAPNALIFVLGPFGGRRGPDAPTLALELAFQAAVAVLAETDPLIFFIAINTTVPTAIQNGTSNVSAPTTNGNAAWSVSSDQTHPTNLGHALIGYRVAEQMRAIINAL